jgi:hypothetical protein
MSISGTWNFNTNGAKGTLRLNEENGVVTGTAEVDSNAAGPVEDEINGSFDGHTIRFKRTVKVLGPSAYQEYVGIVFSSSWADTEYLKETPVIDWYAERPMGPPRPTPGRSIGVFCGFANNPGDLPGWAWIAREAPSVP